MVWCTSCAKKVDHPITYEGFQCCSICGKVIDQDNFAEEPNFVKNAAGRSQLAGNYVRTIQSDHSFSRERILRNAYEEMNNMACGLVMDDGDAVVRPAVGFYTIALERNFTRGRRRDLVQASCLYIACRENKKPFLLIDFSEYLRVNVYVLGGTFLQLCKLLCLHEHPIVQKPVDPSLFIHRFANRLVGDSCSNVSKTALRIIASMKRDWMQTGRKPSGLCGAALYISALSHGHKFSKSDIVKVVHICEATLTKRLIEFENTDSASLTIEEFEEKAKELDRENNKNRRENMLPKASGTCEILCEHKDSGKNAFAHGLCESCYQDFIELSGGLDGGSEPPAFQRAERERISNECTDESANNTHSVADPFQELESNKQNMETEGASLPEKLQSGGPCINGDSSDHVDEEASFDNVNGANGMYNTENDESDNFSDIDDCEVDSYLHNEEEKHYKKIIWENMNQEYVKEQAAKEAAAVVATKAFEEGFSNCPEEMQAAQELAAAAAAVLAKSKQEKKQKRAEEAKNAVPAKTAAEATRQLLTKKRLSSKINYDVLEKLFEDPVVSVNSKIIRDNLVPDDHYGYDEY